MESYGPIWKRIPCFLSKFPDHEDFQWSFEPWFLSSPWGPLQQQCPQRWLQCFGKGSLSLENQGPQKGKCWNLQHCKVACPKCGRRPPKHGTHMRSQFCDYLHALSMTMKTWASNHAQGWADCKQPLLLLASASNWTPWHFAWEHSFEGWPQQGST